MCESLYDESTVVADEGQVLFIRRDNETNQIAIGLAERSEYERINFDRGIPDVFASFDRDEIKEIIAILRAYVNVKRVR